MRDTWVCTLAATPAEVGRQGVRPLLQRRSGDDTTPAGVFPLGTVATPQGAISFFGNAIDPGVHGAYRRVQPGDCFGANPNTAGYGHWRVDPTGCTGDDELLETNVQAYEHAVLIGANTEPMVSGDAAGEIPYAAAIFLHRTTYFSNGAPKPTSGCVSISRGALVLALFALPLAAQSAAYRAMETKVNAAIAKFKGNVWLYARNLDTGKTYGIREDEKVRTASTINDVEATIELKITTSLPLLTSCTQNMRMPVTAT